MRRTLPALALPYLVVLAFSFASYLVFGTSLGWPNKTAPSGGLMHSNQFSFYAVLPAILGIKNSDFYTQDARPRMLEKFMRKYYAESPLIPYTYYLVETADRYNLHFTLLVAIAMQESHLCRYTPFESNNCWGLGVYGTRVWRFATYEEAIDALGRTLSRYQSKGRVQPEEIMQLYTPGSDGTWARAVHKFMDEIQETE